MRVTRLSVLVLTGLIASGLWPASARAASIEFPLAGSRIQLVDSGKPSKRRVSFQAKWSGEVGSMEDPRFTSSTLRVIGGPGEGDSGLLRLAEGNWKPIGKNKGFRYVDPAGNIGGVRSIMLRFSKTGGRVKITGGKDRWAYQLAMPQSAITVTLTVGGRTWCAQFGGPAEKNRRGRLVASAAAALAACPCDTFASTWEAIQTIIFERNGCADQACHGDAKQGGLDLRADAAYDSLVNAHSDLGQMLRVRPGSQRDSFLWRKIAVARDDFKSKAEFEAELKNVPGTPMPNGRTPLRAEEVEAIGQWIQKGAPEVGVVPESDKLLNSCLPPGEPLKLPRPDPPAEGTGVQFHLPPWTIAPRNSAGQNGENEVCYSVYYDLTGKIDPQYTEPCNPDYWAPQHETCFRYKKQELSQDPNSHHSIIHLYNGEYPNNDPGWKNRCHGGPMNGTACDPTVPGVSAPAGAECGEGGICHGAVISSVACIFGFGPEDYSGGVTGGGSQTAPTFSGSQQPYFERNNPDGVYAQLPIKGTIVINSHAFNIYDVPATNEQWLNMYFATPAESLYPMRAVFDSDDIFVQNVPPYKEVEYCRTALFPRGTRISELSSHTHQRGRLFRVWGPPSATITPACHSTTGNPGACVAEASTPIMTTVEYNDPAQLRFDPPLKLDDQNPDTRRFKFCSIYDNGFNDPSEVKRNSTSPPALLGGKCFTRNGNTVIDRGIQCAEPAAKRGQLCHGNNSECDSAPGAGDGVCDACPLRGGVSTEDEMFILLGSFFCEPNTPCSGVCRTGPKEGQFCNYSQDFCESPPGEKWCNPREYNNN